MGLDYTGNMNFQQGHYVDPFAGLQATLGGISDRRDRNAEVVARLAQQELENSRAARAEQRVIDDRALATNEKNSAVDFGTAVLNHGGKTWNDFGNQLNANADRVTSAMALTDEEMKNPLSESAKAKMNLQQGLSDTYDKSGQKMYESEKMNDILNSRKQSGQLITNVMLSAMAGAKKAEEEQRQALSKTDLGLAKDYKDNADKMMLERIKLGSGERNADARSSSGSGSSKEDKSHGASVKDIKTIKDYISGEISPMGISIGEGALKKSLDEAISKGMSQADILKNFAPAIDRGWLDTTFDPSKVGTSVSKGGGSSGFNKVVGRSDFSGLDRLEAENRIAATNAAQDAKSVLMDPNDSRALKARTMFDNYMGELNKRNISAPTTSAEGVKTGSNGTSIDTSSSKGTKAETVDSVAGGLTDKGVLNADATKSINDRLSEMGIRRIAAGMTPEEANTTVSTLMKPRNIMASLSDTTESVNPYQTVKDQAVENYNTLNARTDISPVNKAVQQLAERVKYGTGTVGDLSSRALIGLDNMGTTIGNAFRVEQKPMMSVKEGQKAFRELSLDTDTMKQGRARTAASYQESKRNNAIEKVINDPTTSPEEQFTLLLNLGLSKSAAKKASGYR